MKISEATALIRTPSLSGRDPNPGAISVVATDIHDCASAVVSFRKHSSCRRFRPAGAASNPGRVSRSRKSQVLADLRNPGLHLPSVDGILMANSLHFIGTNTYLKGLCR